MKRVENENYVLWFNEKGILLLSENKKTGVIKHY